LSKGEKQPILQLLLDQIHPDDRESYQLAVKKALETDQPFQHEWRMISPSGKIKWLWASSLPERQDDHIIYWHGIAMDITERKELECALQKSETKLREILDNAIGIVTRLIVKPNGEWEIDYISGGCKNICGYTAEELTTNKNLWVNIIFEGDWENIEAQVYADIFAVRSGSYEYRINHKNGDIRWVSQHNYSYRDEENDQWFLW